MIIKFGDDEDFSPVDDATRLAAVLKRSWSEACPAVLEGFRIGVTQEPYKHHLYVCLLLQLSRKHQSDPIDEDVKVGEKRKASDDGPDHGREIIQDLTQAFRIWVEGRQWLNMRLTLQFFALLVVTKLISAESILGVCTSLLAVLSELGGGGDRAERVIRAVSEALMRCGHVLYVTNPDSVEHMIGMIENAILNRGGGKVLYDPICPIMPRGQETEPYQDSLGNLLASLHALRSSDPPFVSPQSMPRPWEEMSLPEGMVQSEAVYLEAVSMPPELFDSGDVLEKDGEGLIGSLRLFGDDIVPSPDTADGWILRSLVLDILTIFEINRKECARILLSLPRYLTAGTFKPPATTAAPAEVTSVSTLSCESLIIATIFSAMLTLPSSALPLIYYGSVITELCKVSPNTVAPPVGRAVRRMFAMLGSEGLDIEVTRRLSEWLAIHLSNFGFQWMWKEWISELELPASHPRRAFMRRLAELEVRLAYYDRIVDTLPPQIVSEKGAVLPAEPPEPAWLYEKEEHHLFAEANELLRLLRAKTPSSDVRTYITTLPLAYPDGPSEPMSQSITLMAIETILHLGSRSFSHFLNATERYLDLLRFLSPDPTARRLLLDGIRNYWRWSSQLRLMTVDKYMQYGILEGEDVVDWVFGQETGGSGGEEGDGWTDFDHWELLRMCIGKLVGRVSRDKSRVKNVEREDEAARARKAAERIERGEGVGMDDVEIVDDSAERSKELRDAQTSLDINTTTLEHVLLNTTKHFISTLLPWVFDPSSTSQGLAGVLRLLDSGEEGFWAMRARWGWWREFVRLYSIHLSALVEPVQKAVWDGIPKREEEEESVEVRAEGMVKDVWRFVVTE
ncbi:hypothetical protein TREMEDRAFT_43823 [Tremella mesenterica DSM 1558]|nr:uncharacterized protein TREMEDRAFT_43823 [Tremella mesenterica DSM 1558]EIW70239.1 hypothetical protein TREMEDRAFT_43823 [Tremella mesenterica DSM 1558]